MRLQQSQWISSKVTVFLVQIALFFCNYPSPAAQQGNTKMDFCPKTALTLDLTPLKSVSDVASPVFR